MELIEGVNIGQLPDIFEYITNKDQILKIKGDESISSLNNDYKKFAMEMIKRDGMFRDIKEGEIINGRIFSINRKEIIIDIGFKDFLYVDNKLSDLKIIENLKPGDNIDAVITEINDSPYSIKGSITDIIRLKVSDKLKNHYNDDEYLTAIVKEMKPAGFMLDIEMDNIIVNAFMPTTLAGVNKLTDQQKEELVGQKIRVMLETLQQDKGIYVVSRRKYLQSLMNEELNKIKKAFDEDKEKIYEGYVTGAQEFGVFIEFSSSSEVPPSLTGMIHRYNINNEWTDDVNWKKIVPGMAVNFYIKDIILKKKKIILTQILRKSLWDTIRKDKVIEGKVIDIKPFGALIQLDEETNGLIQNSYIQKNNIKLKAGDSISVRVLSVIKDDRKIYLSINNKKSKDQQDNIDDDTIE